jgi:hypothetical protein
VATPAPPAPPPPAPFGFTTERRAFDPRRSGTLRAVDQIRKGISIYLVVPLLSVVNALVITGIILATNSYVVGNFGGSGIGGLVESDSLAVSVVGGLTGFVAFILTIVSWVTWRSGIRDLTDVSSEYGPRQIAAARRARQDFDYTVYTYIATLLFGIAVAVVLVLLLLSAIMSDLNSGQSSATAVANALASALAVLLVVAIVTVLLTVLLYHFSTRSLVGSLSATASPPTVAHLARARTIILLGAVLGILSEGALASRFLYPLAIVSPLVLVIGFVMMRSAYSEWLRDPPPVTGVAEASQGFVIPGSFPPPPPRF